MPADVPNAPTSVLNTEATITVRVIKSFEYRTERNLVLRKVDLRTTTVGQLKEMVKQAIQSGSVWRPYRNVALDTLKLYTQPHGAKTSNLIINLDHDEWILNDDDKVLADVGFENETEASFFNRAAYETYKCNPEIRWDAPN